MGHPGRVLFAAESCFVLAIVSSSEMKFLFAADRAKLRGNSKGTTCLCGFSCSFVGQRVGEILSCFSKDGFGALKNVR